MPMTCKYAVMYYYPASPPSSPRGALVPPPPPRARFTACIAFTALSSVMEASMVYEQPTGVEHPDASDLGALGGVA